MELHTRYSFVSIAFAQFCEIYPCYSDSLNLLAVYGLPLGGHTTGVCPFSVDGHLANSHLGAL